MLLVVIALALGLPGLAAAGHLGLLALASLAYREPRPQAHEEVCFLVLVPAHNEATVIGRCLEAIYADADSATWCWWSPIAARTTATVAAGSGRRADELEMSRAERLSGLDTPASVDAVVMLDAGVIAPGFFGACERALAG
jgi:hypothetical protein